MVGATSTSRGSRGSASSRKPAPDNSSGTSISSVLPWDPPVSPALPGGTKPHGASASTTSLPVFRPARSLSRSASSRTFATCETLSRASFIRCPALGRFGLPCKSEVGDPYGLGHYHHLGRRLRRVAGCHDLRDVAGIFDCEEKFLCEIPGPPRHAVVAGYDKGRAIKDTNVPGSLNEPPELAVHLRQKRRNVRAIRPLRVSRIIQIRPRKRPESAAARTPSTSRPPEATGRPSSTSMAASTRAAKRPPGST